MLVMLQKGCKSLRISKPELFSSHFMQGEENSSRQRRRRQLASGRRGSKISPAQAKLGWRRTTFTILPLTTSLHCLRWTPSTLSSLFRLLRFGHEPQRPPLLPRTVAPNSCSFCSFLCQICKTKCSFFAKIRTICKKYA